MPPLSTANEYTDTVPIRSRPCGNPLIDLIVGNWADIGDDYETQANSAIIDGGGLCEADLTADTVLDIVNIQRFITSFTTGCDL